MHTKNQISLTRKALYGIMLLGAFISAFVAGNLPSARAQGTMMTTLTPELPNYSINTGNYQIPNELLIALKSKLGDIATQSGNATAYGVGYYEEHSYWAWVNLSVMNGDYYNSEEIGSTFLFFGVNNNNEWSTAFSENNTEYIALLDSISRDKLTADEIKLLEDYYYLNQSNNRTALSGNLLFPWSNTQNSWTIGSLGFHTTGYTAWGAESGSEAVDLKPPSSISSARVISMESGQIINKVECNWNTFLLIRHDGFPAPKSFVYMHIQNGTAPSIGASIVRGQYLGSLHDPRSNFNGIWSGSTCASLLPGQTANCERDPGPGTYCSGSDWPHLHLGFGTDRNISINGNVVANLNPGSSYNSTNQEVSGESGSVGGLVFNTSGPVSGANVHATTGGTSAITDINGSYVLDFVPAGNTTIKASASSGQGTTTLNVQPNMSQQAPNITLIAACIPGNGMSQAVGLDSCPPGSTIDNATFISDVTLPDGTVVSPGQALTKTWRVQNTGTSTWDGFKLNYTDGEQMGGSSEITIPTTTPGQTIDLTVNLVAPSSLGAHSGSWQIVNTSGGWVNGGKLWVKINVGSQSGVITLTTDPSSPASAGQVNIFAHVSNFPNLRALRILIDGQQLCELGAPEIQDCVWHTSGYAAGQHSIVAEADDWTGPSWDNPERKTILYELTGNGVTNHGPYRPTLVANPAYDWYVTIGNAPQLCAQQQGDPDGDAVTQYRFVASASVGTADSGWVGSSCHTFGSITPGTYEWHAQVMDSLGGISDWSDNWHFTVEPTGVTATINSFSTPSPSNAEEIKIYACSSGHAGINITLRVLVNDATDGSDSGEWHIIKEQGSPCFNDIDAPVWRTLEYDDGPHKVRVVAMAIQPDAGNVYDTVYTLNHRRPNSPRLIAPVPLSQNIQEAIYLDSQTVTFKWEPTIRATSYTLHISTNPSPKDDPSPIFRQTFSSSINEHTLTLGQDYSSIYWQVEATNDVGSNASGAQRFGIDRQVPACTVSGLPATTYANVFQVNWNSTDNLAGIKTADIQFMDSERGTWEDWLTNIPSGKTYDLFDGQPGHSYFFRCRATDNANNTGNYPISANTSITIDPFTRPGTPWWNSAYGQKRNIVILNNMGATPLPQGYPIHLHFDNSTIPTAATLYAASLSSIKCNDLRIVYGDAVELDRVVQKCTSNAIDIWFRSQVSITGGSTNNASHQLYYGNSSAGFPPANQGNVFYPLVDANTVAAWYMSEGQGNTLNDLSGNGHACTIFSPTSWATPTKFPGALNFSGGGDSQTVNCGTSSAYNLQNFTFETYFRSTNNNLWGRMAGNIQPNSQRWILQTVDNKPELVIWTSNNGGSVTSTKSLADNAWHHLAVTVNGTELKLYIDGQLNATSYLPGNIRSADLPLTIGSAENISRSYAELTGIRLSNVVRTDFSYGAFVNVTNEPSIATDSVVNPPVIGAPDLTILSLSTYPNPQGGILVEAVVENQGDLSTQSGFYTDLYLNHVPTGAGDYSNSLRFWINDPIDAGQTTTLTTVITDLSTLSATTMPGNPITNVVSTFTESSGTLYAQTDSAGLVQEPDNQNNIYSSGIQICTATSDTFENDNTYATASLFTIGNNQTHNFSFPGDNDWIKFNAQAGKIYRLTTSALGVSADTYLYLYDVNGTTLISSNDDSNGSLASRIEWTAPANGIYYILIKHWNPSVGGCGTQYNLNVQEGLLDLFLPLILR